MFRVVSVAAARQSAVLLKRIDQGPARCELRCLLNSYRSFHVTSVLGGRHSGGSAFEQDTRDFSKKQKKRWKVDGEKRRSVQELKAKKVEEKILEKQVGGEEMMSFYEKTKNSMQDVLRDMMLPTGLSVIHSGADVNKAEFLPGVPGLANVRIDPQQILFDEHWRNKSSSNLSDGRGSGVGMLGAGGIGGSAYDALVDEIMNVSPLRVLSALNSARGSGSGSDAGAGDGNGNGNLLGAADKARGGSSTATSTSPTTSAAVAVSSASDDVQLTPSDQARSLLHPATMAIAVMKSLQEGKQEQTQELLRSAREHQIYLESTGAKGPHSVMTKSSTPALDYFNNLLKTLLAEQMRAMAVKSDYDGIQRLFKSMVSADVEPDAQAWEWLILSESWLYPVEKAIASIERLKSLRSPLTTGMFNSVLSRYIRDVQLEPAQAWWLRMHREPNLPLDEDSFLQMLKHCSLTHSAEKAFWLLDEMKSRGITPTLRAFNKVIRACAEAPQWVHGYEDTVFDALAMLEGAELEPNVETYNNIMYAFGRGGDSRAAEYYFWEMQSKGIVPNVSTYNVLLHAYSKAQSVGASKYAYLGRFAKGDRLLQPASEEVRAHQELGGTAIAKLWSEGVHYAVDGDDKRNARGGKYNRGGGVVDLLDDEETSMDLADQIRWEASEVVREHGTVRDQLIKTGAIPTPPGYVAPLRLPPGGGGGGGGGSGNGRWEREGSERGVGRLASGTSGGEMAEETGEDDGLTQTLEQMAQSDPELAELLASLEEPGSGDSSASQKLLAKLEAEQAEEEAYLQTLLAQPGGGETQPATRRSQSAGIGGRRGRRRSAMVPVPEDDFEEERESQNQREGAVVAASNPSTSAALSASTTWDESRHLWKTWADPYPTQRASYKREQRKSRAEPDAGLIRLDSGSSGNSDTTGAGGGRGGAQDLMSALMALDGGEVPKGLFAGADGTYNDADDYIGEAWDRIEFGRAPSAEYLHCPSTKRSIRLYENRIRAKLAFDELTSWMQAPPLLLSHELRDMAASPPADAVCASDAVVDELRPWRVSVSPAADDSWARFTKWHEVSTGPPPEGKLRPDDVTLTSLLSVYAECKRDVDAITVLRSFPNYGVRPSAQTFRSLLRMYVRKNDITKAVALKEDMQTGALGQPMQPDKEFFGMLIEALTHRGDIPQALKLLEEMTSLDIKVKDYHLRKLRARCQSLGVKHPDMPDDPLQWVKDVKRIKALHEPASQRRIQPVQSALYTRT